jgi:hypothetical protein
MNYRDKIIRLLTILPEYDICFIYHFLCEYYEISVGEEEI